MLEQSTESRNATYFYFFSLPNSPYLWCISDANRRIRMHRDSSYNQLMIKLTLLSANDQKRCLRRRWILIFKLVYDFCINSKKSHQNEILTKNPISISPVKIQKGALMHCIWNSIKAHRKSFPSAEKCEDLYFFHVE